MRSHALNGLMHAPRSRRALARIRVTKPAPGISLAKLTPFVRFVRRSKFFETAGTSPVEFAVFNDQAAQGRAVAADEFRSRMDDDVSAVFERTEEERRSEGVVNDDRKAVFVGDVCDGFEVRNIDGRVAKLSR